MTNHDPVSELARVLYNALHDEDPRVAPLFGHDTDILRPVLSTVLAEAATQRWIQKQLDETAIRSIDFRNGMHMDLQAARELLAHQVAAARTMLGDAPNYSETKLEWDIKVAESPELYTIVIQRHAPGALTPHEARQKAEARVAELEAELRRLRGDTDG
ncbi:hypothetical protein D0Z67_29390 (plasmid) [Streptomyces seoulensis]|uniref:Uncharacterized protein n=1 Tax=Streptomyces seoulensis TaxID=73044 RepID=A0A4P6U5R8_STRSO|nr:hypothetical protein [Streptomyces seoulensis]QBJ94484.1 hypothetical protein D0Z67_29390 [Streptomyces seoulensis]